jgi:hypothetical protein
MLSDHEVQIQRRRRQDFGGDATWRADHLAARGDGRKQDAVARTAAAHREIQVEDIVEGVERVALRRVLGLEHRPRNSARAQVTGRGRRAGSEEHEMDREMPLLELRPDRGDQVRRRIGRDRREDADGVRAVRDRPAPAEVASQLRASRDGMEDVAVHGLRDVTASAPEDPVVVLVRPARTEPHTHASPCPHVIRHRQERLEKELIGVNEHTLAAERLVGQRVQRRGRHDVDDTTLVESGGRDDVAQCPHQQSLARRAQGRAGGRRHDEYRHATHARHSCASGRERDTSIMSGIVTWRRLGQSTCAARARSVSPTSR